MSAKPSSPSSFFPPSLPPSPFLELQSLLTHQHFSPSLLPLLVLPPGLALGELKRQPAWSQNGRVVVVNDSSKEEAIAYLRGGREGGRERGR